jgi:hypothetical protein
MSVSRVERLKRGCSREGYGGRDETGGCWRHRVGDQSALAPHTVCGLRSCGVHPKYSLS